MHHHTNTSSRTPVTNGTGYHFAPPAQGAARLAPPAKGGLGGFLSFDLVRGGNVPRTPPNPPLAGGAKKFARTRTPNAERRTPNAAFTLIELLVVILILLTIAAVTVSAINVSIDGDKVRSGARQVQSYLAGARDRAIYAKEPRGVRFILDPNDPRVVTSMVYIAPTEEYWTEGQIQLERIDENNNGIPDVAEGFGTQPEPGNAWVVRAFDSDVNDGQQRNLAPSNWPELLNQGVLRDGNRIRLPDANGSWYTIQVDLLRRFNNSNNVNTYYPPRLRLQQSYRELPTNNPPTSSPIPPPRRADGLAAFRPGDGPQGYQLELSPAPMPNQEPVQLPRGVVIHLDRCSAEPDVVARRGESLPADWRDFTREDRNNNGVLDPGEDWNNNGSLDPSDVTQFSYSTYLDVMFSPRGTVIGTAASRGLIHLYVGEQKDSDQDRIDWPNVAMPPAYQPSARDYVPRPSDNRARGDKRLVTIFTRTGQVAVYAIHPGDEDTNGNGVLDAGEDTNGNAATVPYPERTPLFYAVTGEVSGR
jgi:prepilin-type N-terminal cleavage/methylation domain-containing protein